MRPNQRDELILEFLDEKDIALPPTPIYENLRLEGATFSQRTVRRRLRTLLKHGFVEKVIDEKRYYKISDKGREYLARNSDSDK